MPGKHDSFTKEYRCHHLVWFERYATAVSAIAREKQLKGWRRSKKVALIEEQNLEWQDLSKDWDKTLPHANVIVCGTCTLPTDVIMREAESKGPRATRPRRSKNPQFLTGLSFGLLADNRKDYFLFYLNQRGLPWKQ